MATKRKEPESQRISWFLYSFELPLYISRENKKEAHVERHGNKDGKQIWVQKTTGKEETDDSTGFIWICICTGLVRTVKENDYRQYNTCYCEIPKKNGKSELAAAIALYMTCDDGEWGAEVYGCASDRQQASIVFDVAVDMVDQWPALKKRIKPVMSVKRLVYKPTNSFYQVLSAEAYTKHGLNVHAVIFDELHAQPEQTEIRFALNSTKKLLTL